MKKRAQGSALIIVMVMILVATLIGVAFLRKSTSAVNTSGQRARKTVATYAAETGLQKGLMRIKDSFADADPASDIVGRLKPAVDGTYFAAIPPGYGEDLVAPATFHFTTGGCDVRYRLVTLDNAWTYDDTNDFAERRYAVDASALCANNVKSVLRQEMIVRRETQSKGFISSDDNILFTNCGETTFRGTIHSNKTILINNCSPNTSMSFLGSVSALRYIYSGSGTGAQKIFWEDDSPLSSTEFTALTQNSASGSSFVDSVMNESFTGWNGWLDLNDPAKMGPKITCPSCTYEEDPRWKASAAAAYHDRLKDGNLGATYIPPPPTNWQEPGNRYDNAAALKIVTSSTDPDFPGKITVSVFDAAGNTVVKKYFDPINIGSLYETMTLAAYDPGTVVGALSSDDTGAGPTIRTLSSGLPKRYPTVTPQYVPTSIPPPVTPIPTPGPYSVYDLNPTVDPPNGPTPGILRYNDTDLRYVSPELGLHAPSVDVITRRGLGPDAGTIHHDTTLTTYPNVGCGNAFFVRREWDGNEDMFRYVTDIDVKRLQANCGLPDPASAAAGANVLVYATRTDAVADTTIDKAPNYNVDPDRHPNGYRLQNGEVLAKPLFFVSDVPVAIKGDFNVHQRSDGLRRWELDKNADGVPDIESSEYTKSAAADDTWKPAYIFGDRIKVQSAAYDERIHNLRRWSDGLKNEHLKLEGPTAGGAVSPKYCNSNTCQIPEAADLEVNAVFVAGQTVDPPLDKSPGGFPKFILQTDERFATLVLKNPDDPHEARNHRFRTWGSFLNLYPAKYATNYYKDCKVGGYGNLMGSGGTCGPWAKGGSGGGWPYEGADKRSYSYDRNLLDSNKMPQAFRDLSPAGPATTRIPYEISEYISLDTDPLRP